MTPRADILTPANVIAMETEAKACFPGEACGVVRGDGVFHRMTNRSRHASVRASYGAEFHQLLAARDIVAVFHSHPHPEPEGLNAPSPMDMRFQLSSGVPHIIIATDGTRCLPPILWGDGVEPEPVLLRGYQWGVSDGLTCIRDWLRQDRRPCPPNLPRAYPDTYPEGWLQNYTPREDRPQVGDLCVIIGLAQTEAGVYVGAGRILTHPSIPLPYAPDHRAVIQPLTDWLDRGARIFRHEKACAPLRPSG